MRLLARPEVMLRLACGKPPLTLQITSIDSPSSKTASSPSLYTTAWLASLVMSCMEEAGTGVVGCGVAWYCVAWFGGLV